MFAYIIVILCWTKLNEAELIQGVDYCNSTRCSNFRHFTYKEAEDLLSCVCLPGWSGSCCQVETQCVNGDWLEAKSICKCWDDHYSGDRCDIVSCENDGLYVPEERWASPTATGCTCYKGNSGDFCQEGGNAKLMTAGKTVRVRIVTTTQSKSYSTWNRPSTSPHYHHTHIDTYSTSRNSDGGGGNLVWLWVLIVCIVLFLVLVCVCTESGTKTTSTSNTTHVVYTGDNYGSNNNYTEEKITTTETVVEVEMTEDEANALMENPDLAANYTSYYDTPDGDTTTTIEIIRD